MGKRDKNRKSNRDETDNTEETRFLAAENRPQFRPLKQKESKVVLDERFSSVLTDPRFQLQERDKYGRKKKKKQDAKEELSSFYMVEKDDNETQHSDADDTSETSSDHDDNSVKSDESKEENSNDDNEDPASRIAYLTALSRGEIDASSSEDEDDSSDSSDDEDEEGEDPVYGNAGVLDPSTKDEDVEISYDSSPYLVVQNLDWDHIRAIDLYSLLSSFTSPGAVKRVQIYQSDFGMERMEKDKVHGPSDVWKKPKTKSSKSIDDHQDSSDEDSSQEEEEEEEDSMTSRDDDSSVESENVVDESDFDPEKLRAYEASKLKYYFAIVEFSTPDHADIAYREVDGMEFERSSAAIDLRTLPTEALEGVVDGRPMRDEATSVPSNYEPPEFVVNALQQTSVECTWDKGDTERERALTKYGSGGWQDMMETDDLKAYMASDASSDDDSDDDRADKSSKMRKLLGLDSDDESKNSDSEEEEASESEDDSSADEEEAVSKEIKYIPGKKGLEDKIRSKIMSKEESEEELTPWQKYQEKRKQKRRERRQARRGKKDDNDTEITNKKFSEPKASSDASDEDDFFVDNDSQKGRKAKNEEKSRAANNQELELLLAGDNAEEEERDYDIRGIQRMEKNKGKKLKGGRKRKEEKIAADVSGTAFKVDVNDNRFSAVLDGSDGRFGIDKTDPSYKDTSAMRDILAEQTRRRKKKRKTQKDDIVPNVNAESGVSTSSGANALSSLVKRLKSKVGNVQ